MRMKKDQEYKKVIEQEEGTSFLEDISILCTALNFYLNFYR